MNASAGEKSSACVLFVVLPIALAHAGMYAEDGQWTSLIYQMGGFASSLGGRGDYFVVGKIRLDIP